jgi:3-dehydroquinate synthase II
MVWIRADKGISQDARKIIVTTALENNFSTFIVSDEDKEVFKKLGKCELITLDKYRFTLSDKSGEYVIITSKSDEERASELAGETAYVVVSAKDWKVIPVENLIASFQKTESKLLVEVNSPEEARLFFETLEVGVDGVVLNTDQFEAILEMRRLMDTFETGKVDLVPAVITRLESVGTGDRVCIDTCSILNVGEGMLIGSQSGGLFLVHSESVEAEYVDTRPFRVNAGPVHAYIYSTNDRTRYLSDLSAGEEVLAVDLHGNTRPVVIGRVKVEKRPLMLVEVEYEDKKYNIILQNAETIRLVSGDKPVSIVDLKKGDKILIWLEESGRHFGMKVDESILEK